MELGFSLDSLQSKLGSDPLKTHLVKRVVILVVSITVGLSAWTFVAGQVFKTLFQLDSVASPLDTEILARTNAAVDQTMQVAVAKQGSASFGEEVEIKTTVADNPFMPLVRPKPEKEPEKTLPPEPPPEDRLALRGLAKVGGQYMAIIADANGNSQVIYKGADFNGWKVKMLKADKVQLTKGERSMMLAWEGI